MSSARILPLLALAFACERPATQLIVVVDTDYDVPGGLASMRAVVRDASGLEISSLERQLVTGAPAAGQANMPCSFTVVPKDGDADRTVIIEVEGLAPGGRTLVARRAVTGFLKGKTLRLDLFLAESCEDEDCESGRTCVDGACLSDVVDPNDLPEVTPGTEIVPRSDAGAIDAGDAATPDGAVDAGDAGDAGVEDVGCPPAPGAPAVIGMVRLPHGIDEALLAADVDGDGVGELVATRGGDVTSDISVIDFDACGAPGVHSALVSGDLRRPSALVQGMSGPEIWVPARTGLEAWRFSASLGTPLERIATVLETEDLDQLAIANHGMWAGAVVRHASWGVAHVGTQTRQELFTDQADRPRNLTYVGEVAAGALFAGSSATVLRLLEPGGGSSVPIAGLSDAVSFGPDASFGIPNAPVVVTTADRAIVGVRIDLATGETVTSSNSFPARIIGEPMLMRVQGEARVYVSLSSDLYSWCTLSGDAVSLQCVPANPSDGFGTEIEDEGANTGMLSAYIDGDATPDLVLVTKEGDVHFRSGVRPADPAASRVQLQGEPKLPVALIPRFWEAFGATGDLLAVPYEDGTIVLISWAAPAAAPVSNVDVLWTQARRDSHRSAHLP